MEVDDNHPLVQAMNDAQEKRNALLDKAIEVLAAQRFALVAAEFTRQLREP